MTFHQCITVGKNSDDIQTNNHQDVAQEAKSQIIRVYCSLFVKEEMRNRNFLPVFGKKFDYLDACVSVVDDFMTIDQGILKELSQSSLFLNLTI